MKKTLYLCHSLFCPTPNITLLTARPSCEQPALSYFAGQYVKATLNNGTPLLLSIANAPREDGSLVFHLRHHSNECLTQYWLNEIQSTGKIMLEGPFGQNTLSHHQGQKNLIFLAGGTGFAPLRALLETLSLQPPSDSHIKLFWGVSRPDDVYDMDFLHQLKTKLNHFQSYIVLSDPTHFSAWPGPTGWVHEYCHQLIQRFENTLVYASGPFEMIQTAWKSFTKSGLQRNHFLSDMSV